MTRYQQLKFYLEGLRQLITDFNALYEQEITPNDINNIEREILIVEIFLKGMEAGMSEIDNNFLSPEVKLLTEQNELLNNKINNINNIILKNEK